MCRFGGDADQIKLIVNDFGEGFDFGATVRGVGITSMHERVKALQGHLTIHSHRRRGTSIRARVPLA